MQRLALTLISLSIAQVASSAPSRALTLERPAQPQSDRVEQSTRWVPDNSFGFSVRIDSEMLTRREPYLSPNINIFIEHKDFTEENLRKVFSGFSELYSHAFYLSVTAISDIRILERRSSVFSSLGSEPDGFIPGTGQFGAFFSRWDGEEKFQYTPRADRPDLVQVILKTRAGGAQAPIPNSVLKRAAIIGDTARLKELFDQGEGTKFKSILNFTPLIYAAREGTSNTVRKLLAEGAEVNARNCFGRTALLEAILVGNTQAIPVLLRNHSDLDARDNHQNSALILAVLSNQVEIVRLLLANGVDVRETDETGASALMTAKAKNRDTAMIRMLEEAERKH